jgi:hypothetical protein
VDELPVAVVAVVAAAAAAAAEVDAAAACVALAWAALTTVAAAALVAAAWEAVVESLEVPWCVVRGGVCDSVNFGAGVKVLLQFADGMIKAALQSLPGLKRGVLVFRVLQ